MKAVIIVWLAILTIALAVPYYYGISLYLAVTEGWENIPGFHLEEPSPPPSPAPVPPSPPPSPPMPWGQ